MKKVLLTMVAVIAFTSTTSGLLMISNPGGGIINLPVSLLEGSPFKNFLVPGILLLVLVGGSSMIAIYALLTASTERYNWTIISGFILCGWIIMQMILIHVGQWLQFIYLGMGILIILLAYHLKGKWAV